MRKNKQRKAYSERHERYISTSRKSRAGEGDSGSLVSLPDRLPKRSRRNVLGFSQETQRREPNDNRAESYMDDPTDRGISPGEQALPSTNVRGYAAPTGDQIDAPQKEFGGPNPATNPQPDWNPVGEVAGAGGPTQLEQHSNHNSKQHPTDRTSGEDYTDARMSAVSATPSFIRSRNVLNDDASIASSSFSTDTSSAAGHSRAAMTNAIMQENKELRHRLESMERMMQQLIQANAGMRGSVLAHQTPIRDQRTQPRQPRHEMHHTTTTQPQILTSAIGASAEQTAVTQRSEEARIDLGTPATSHQQPRGKPTPHPRKVSPSEPATKTLPPGGAEHVTRNPSPTAQRNEGHTPSLREIRADSPKPSESDSESARSQTLEYHPPPPRLRGSGQRATRAPSFPSSVSSSPSFFSS